MAPVASNVFSAPTVVLLPFGLALTCYLLPAYELFCALLFFGMDSQGKQIAVKAAKRVAGSASMPDQAADAPVASNVFQRQPTCFRNQSGLTRPPGGGVTRPPSVVAMCFITRSTARGAAARLSHAAFASGTTYPSPPSQAG